MKHIKHSIIRSICTIVLILTVFCACNLSLSACTFSPPLTRAYLIETFDITEADLEGINVEAVTEYYDLRQNITPENVSDIINRLKTLEADMIEETSQPLYFTTYIYTGKAARKAFSADDIKYFAFFRNPGYQYYTTLIDFENGIEYTYGSDSAGKINSTSLNAEELENYRNIIDSCEIYRWKGRYIGHNGCTTGSYAWNVGIELYDGSVYSYYGCGIKGANQPASYDILLENID